MYPMHMHAEKITLSNDLYQERAKTYRPIVYI